MIIFLENWYFYIKIYDIFSSFFFALLVTVKRKKIKLRKTKRVLVEEKKKTKKIGVLKF